MAERKRVEEAWLGFQTGVIPKDAPQIQHKEMRRAFYAGAWAMLLMAYNLGEESVSEEAGAAVLEEIRDEIQAFLALVGKGGDSVKGAKSKGFGRSYPRGRISADDDGASQMAIARDPDTNTLLIRFPKPTAWIGLGPDEVSNLLTVFAKHLATMKGVPVSVSIGDGGDR